jgi:hypothetical protein
VKLRLEKLNRFPLQWSKSVASVDRNVASHPHESAAKRELSAVYSQLNNQANGGDPVLDDNGMIDSTPCAPLSMPNLNITDL